MRPFHPRLFLFAALCAGCVQRNPNPPLAAAAGQPEYYFHTHQRPRNSPDTLLLLCFSGGGTRAAAFSYGVLEELHQTAGAKGAGDGTMLDEVDAISSVSGGSVTAAAYALYGEQIFETFEAAFLKHDVQRNLVGRVFNPFRWNKLWSGTYGRSDLAADYYDEILFHGATFDDLARQPGAYVCINATDISSGARFGFTQYQFDLICADLNHLRVAQAVAASSAVPGLLTPITLNNYAGTCGYEFPAWLRPGDARTSTNLTGRVRFHLMEMDTYLQTNRPYLHLVDGGVADNLGVRAALDGLLLVEASPQLRERYDMSKVSRVAILCVNAYSAPEKDWDKHESPPGSLALAVAGAGIPMDRYSYESIELLKEQVARWRERAREERGRKGVGEELRFYPIIISFAAIADPVKRRHFLNLPTSFQLPADAVDQLQEAGRQLLRESPDYQDFQRDVNGTAPVASR